MSNIRKIFNKIYDKYIGKIYRFVFIKVNSKEIAEDLTSETFLRIWKNLERGNKIEKPGAFLYKIARNLVTDYYREKAKPIISLADVEYEQVVDSSPISDIHEQSAKKSDFEIVKAAINTLGEDYQDVLNLRYVEDYSIEEIAEILDRPEGTVRVMLHRGLEELKGKLNIKSA